MTVAQQLLAFRGHTGLTQREVAELIPIHWRTYQRWEAGETTRPAPAIWARVQDLMRDHRFPMETR